MKLPDHLGGHAYTTHLDCSNLLYLKNKYNMKSMVDIGCGPGDNIREGLSLGIDSYGIDGDFTLDYSDLNVVINDFTKSAYRFNRNFDLAWSVEFVEHVPEKFISNYMPVFQEARYVFMTHSPYENEYHFNVKESSYWVELFSRYGFTFLEEETNFIRQNSSMKRDFVRNFGHFFKNERVT